MRDDQSQLLRSARGRADYPRWLPLVPAAMLVVLGALNLVNVWTRGSTPFFSGGFGMHSTYASPLFRFFRVYRVLPDGLEERVEFRQPGPLEPALHTATPERLTRLLRQRVPQAAGTYRVELWQFGYRPGYTSRDARITIDLVMDETLELER